jgi:enoyl-CoA hydratase
MNDPRLVLSEIRGRVALLTLNRPEKRNALDSAMRAALLDALGAVVAEPRVGAIVVTGAGGAAFAAGADINELAARTPVEQREVMRRPTIFDAVERAPKPVIAAINGICLGAGLELALAADLRIASEGARFGQPEICLGIIPGGGATQRLPRLVGFGAAMRLVLTGDPIHADEALRLRLVEEVLPIEVLVHHAVALAERIAARSPVALAAAKEAVRASLSVPLDAGLDREAALFQLCFTSEDRREGMRAFLEKRAAGFTGR